MSIFYQAIKITKASTIHLVVLHKLGVVEKWKQYLENTCEGGHISIMLQVQKWNLSQVLF